MNNGWIHWPRQEGVASRQAHVDLPEGTFEREMGKEGFAGPSTQFHHQHAPTSWESIEGPARPRAFNTNRLNKSASPYKAPTLISNRYLQFRIWQTDQSMDHLVRNGDGDELIFIHQGEAELFCDYGHMSVREGDYILLPRGTLWRIEVSAPLFALLIEATNESFTLPEKGLLGTHALFDPAMLDVPVIDDAFKKQQGEDTWKVLVKREQQLTQITYPYNPLDAIGWHGSLMPLRINWRDIRPINSHRYHLPPTVHATFMSRRFMITTFCPRPLESDPKALKVPFYHNNNDYEEVIFYHQGQFFSRDNIGLGSVTFHPFGITHGPHPSAYKAAFKPKRTETDEVAVMIDARDALHVSKEAEPVEWKDYVNSWKS